MRSSTLLALIGASAGCFPQAELTSPLEEGGAALLAVEPPEGDLLLYGVEANQPLPPLTLRHGTALTLIEFAGTLASRGLAAGRLEPAEGPGRPLPASGALHGLIAPGVEWSRLDQLSPRLAAVRLPPIEDCSTDDACSRYFEDRLICERPCPEPTSPAPPEAPAAAALSAFTCPAGWSSDDLGTCAPPPRPAPCPAGWYQPVAEAACRPLSACPSAPERWRVPEDVEGQLRFVDPAVPAGGVGTAEDPASSLEAALVGLSGAVTVALARGNHRAPTPLPDGLRVVGACPEDVVLLGPLLVEAGDEARVEGVQLRSTSDGARIAGRLTLRQLALEAARDGLELVDDGSLDAEGVRIEAVRTGIRARGLGGQIRLVDVTLEGTRSSSIRFDGAQTVTIADTVLSAAAGVGLVATGPAGVSVQTLWIDKASPGPGVRIGGAARLTGGHLHGRADELLEVIDEGQIDLHQVTGRELGRWLRATDGALAVVREVRLHHVGPLPACELSDAASATLSELAARGSADGLFVRAHTNAAVTLEAVELTGFAVSVRQTGAGRLNLRRAQMDGMIEIGATSDSELPPSYRRGPQPCRVPSLSAETSAVRVDLEDVRVQAGDRLAGIALCPGTEAVGRRIAVEGGRAGVYVDCIGQCTGPGRVAEVELTDLDVSGPGSTGIVHRGGPGTYERVRVRQRDDYGFYAWGSQITARDLRIEEIGRADSTLDRTLFCSQAQTGLLRGPEAAVFVESWSTSDLAVRVTGEINLETFALRGAKCAGISTGFDGSFSARDGELSDNLWGLNYLRGDSGELDEDVVFRGNQADVFPTE